MVATAASAATLRTGARRGPGRDDRLMIGQIDLALEVLHGKWTVHLLFFMARGIHRHSELLECLPRVSKKVMTSSLRSLERDGLVSRNVADMPPRVEYSLTPLGWTLTGPLMALSEWGETHQSEVSLARAHAVGRLMSGRRQAAVSERSW